MKYLNRHPTDRSFIVEYGTINTYERKYLKDRNHFIGEDHQCVLYSFGRPVAIVGLTNDAPYVYEVCHTGASEVFKCSTIGGTYWGDEKCIVSMAKKLFDLNTKTDAEYFIDLFDLRSEQMATFEDTDSMSQPRDFLFLAHLHGAKMKKTTCGVELTFRDNSVHYRSVVNETYWVSCSKVHENNNC